MASLINHLKSIITQLTYIKCNIEEDDKVAILLSALPEAYDHLVTILEEKEYVPACKDIINSIQEEERKNNKETTSRGGAYLETSSTKCFTFNKPKHLSKDCYHNNPSPMQKDWTSSRKMLL